MSCWKYWPKIEEIATKLENYGVDSLDDISSLNSVDLDEIKELLDEIEVIAHDDTIDFDSAKHILDDEKMNKALKFSNLVAISSIFGQYFQQLIIITNNMFLK